MSGNPIPILDAAFILDNLNGCVRPFVFSQLQICVVLKCMFSEDMEWLSGNHLRCCSLTREATLWLGLKLIASAAKS